MSIPTRPLTYDDLVQMPEDGNRYEIIGGELVVIPAPIPVHQRVLKPVFRLIDGFVEARGLGEVFFAPLDVQLGEHDIVEPDLIFIARERLGIMERTRHRRSRPPGRDPLALDEDTGRGAEGPALRRGRRAGVLDRRPGRANAAGLRP